MNFVLLGVLILGLSRLGGCISLYAIVRFISVKTTDNEKLAINFWHVWIVWFAGLVRGAIAFGLILTLDGPN